MMKKDLTGGVREGTINKKSSGGESVEQKAALEFYLKALRQEREGYLYQHALNKVRVITRSMKEAEREEYFRSQAFTNTLQQVRRPLKAASR